MTLPYAVVDVETTGLHAGGHDRIVEIAIIRMGSDGSAPTEYDTLINPGRDIGPAWLHGIETRDVLDAPEFGDVAGEIARQLSDAVVVGHNVRFDLGFIEAEFARAGFEIPSAPHIDTLSLALRMDAASRRLEDACTLFGIEVADSHSALGDARATAALFAKGFEHVGLEQMHHWLVRPMMSAAAGWPISPARRPPLPRQRAVGGRRAEQSFVSSLVRRLPVSAADRGDWQEYYPLLDRALENRRVSAEEAAALQQAAEESGLTALDVRSANEAYLRALIDLALSDGVLSAIEMRDMEEVASLLGLDEALPGLLEVSSLLRPVGRSASPGSNVPLVGHTVCFTGALNASINGQRATRELATEVATGQGMIVLKGVTKSLDYLVMADPDSLSGKAKKARTYGTRILAESVFWNLMGVSTDD